MYESSNEKRLFEFLRCVHRKPYIVHPFLLAREDPDNFHKPASIIIFKRSDHHSF
jgi:hypothetical protein